MGQIKQLLQFHEQGKGIKYIARFLGTSRNTVKAYLAKLALFPLRIQDLLAIDGPIPILQAKFHSGNDYSKIKRCQELSMLTGLGPAAKWRFGFSNVPLCFYL